MFSEDKPASPQTKRPGDANAPIVLIHDATRIHARKRLYMTATPRLYTQGARATLLQTVGHGGWIALFHAGRILCTTPDRKERDHLRAT